MKNRRLQGFALFESLLSLGILCFLVTPIFLAFSHANSLIEKEHQQFSQTRQAYEALLSKTETKTIHFQKNNQGTIIGIRFSEKEVRLLD